MGRWLLIALAGTLACGNRSADVLIARSTGVAADGGPDAGAFDLGPDLRIDAGEPPSIDLERELWVYHPYDLDRASNAGPKFVPTCDAPPHTRIVAGAGVVGDALVSTATVGCQNRNTDEWLPTSGPYSLAFFFRVDASAPPGQELRGFELKSLFRLTVDQDDQLRLLLNRDRIRRVLRTPISGTGWHAFALRVDPDIPRVEAFLDGAEVLALDEGIGPVTPQNGGIVAWIGAIDEIRTWTRWLSEVEISALAED